MRPDQTLDDVLREREEYNGKHQAACMEIERLCVCLRMIQQATLDGTVCDDVAWFYGNETLHDYCERMIAASQPAPLTKPDTHQ